MGSGSRIRVHIRLLKIRFDISGAVLKGLQVIYDFSVCFVALSHIIKMLVILEVCVDPLPR